MGRTCEGLADKVWPNRLQDLQDGLRRSYGIPVLFVDTSGRPLTACEDLSNFCRRFTRAVSFSRPCLECGRAEEVQEVAESSVAALRIAPLVHACPLGMLDISLPILSAGEIIGYLITAQVNVADQVDAIDEHAPDSVAREAEEYAVLLSRLPRCSRAELESAGTGLAAVAWLTGELAAARRRNLRLSEKVREQSRWIQERTLNDAVTGLPNRRRFCEALAAETARARRYRRNLSVAVLDIGGFRRLNDEFGHDVGDAVLRAVAHCLSSNLRQTDLVGRIGGDEFAVLLPETAHNEAMIALTRVKTTIEDLNASGELPVEVHVAVGLVDEVAEGEEMLAAALASARESVQVGSLL